MPESTTATAPVLHEEVESIEVLADVFKMGMKGSWSSAGSGEKVALSSTPTTCSGGFAPSMCHNSSYTSLQTHPSLYGFETLHGESSVELYQASSPSSPAGPSAKTVDKHVAKDYERRIKDMVKAHQKASMKRVS
jgi:hypothetical protein